MIHVLHGNLVMIQTLTSCGGGGVAPTLAERVNAWLDSVLSLALRMLELPLVVLLGAGGLVVIGLWLLIRRLVRHGSSPRLVTALRVSLVVVVVLAVALLVDRRLERLHERVDQLKNQTDAARFALLDTVRRQAALRQSFLFDAAAARSALAEHFEGVEVRAIVVDEATDIVQFQSANPLVVAFLAVIDLQCPDLRIVLGADLETKTLTSEFARTNGCSVAINGEAGNSPQPGSGFGRWRGHMVRGGVPVMQEVAQYPRPFLVFDQQNHAALRSADAADRTLPSDPYNVIWGRTDAMRNGEAMDSEYRFNQPRTVMGIDRDGRRLYLLVVDGRQPRHSVGFTRPQVGQFLRAFGAGAAMLCDEGGSSCMYVRQLGGICNTPCDNHGEERPTYTHFGVVTGTLPPHAK